MLVPYIGTNADCKSTHFTGGLWMTRRNQKAVSTKRTKPRPADLPFSPTAYGMSNQSIYNDALTTLPFSIVCYGAKVTRYATKSGYNYWGGVQDPIPNTDYCPTVRTNALLAKIKDEKVNLALLLAEYRKTADAFVQAAHRMVDIYRAIQRLKRHPTDLLNPKKVKRRVSHNVAHQLPKGSQQSRDYLLVRYGLEPTVRDMVGALDVLKNGASRPLIQRVTKSARSVFTSSNGINQNIFPGHHRVFNYRSSTKLTAFIQWRPDDISNQINQLGLSNPLALAWELVPYSFVLDWLIPVGETLASLDALIGSQRTSCTVTKRSEIRMDCSFNGTYRGKAFNRALQGLTPSMPGYKQSTSAIHIADAIALLTKHKL